MSDDVVLTITVDCPDDETPYEVAMRAKSLLEGADGAPLNRVHCHLARYVETGDNRNA